MAKFGGSFHTSLVFLTNVFTSLAISSTYIQNVAILRKTMNVYLLQYLVNADTTFSRKQSSGEQILEIKIGVGFDVKKNLQNHSTLNIQTY